MASDQPALPGMEPPVEKVLLTARLAKRDDGWAVLLYREDSEFAAEEHAFATRDEAEEWLAGWLRLDEDEWRGAPLPHWGKR